MKIVIIDDVSGKPFTISDGSTSRVVGSIVGPDQLDITATRQTQTDQPIRGTSSVQTARGNRRTEVTFQTSILQASISASQQFCLDYDSTVPLSGQVVITTETEGGTAVRYINNATVDSVRSKPEGTTSLHWWRITGSMVTKTKS